MDLRNYGIGAQILRDVNVGRMRLLARPRKMPSMAGFDLAGDTIGGGQVAVGLGPPAVDHLPAASGDVATTCP